MTDEEEKALLAELNDLGEDEVRRRVARQLYGNQTRKRRIVDHWLEKGERERNSVSQAEQIDIARSAKDAAWAAAEAAKDAARQAQSANTRATIGIVISIISIAVASFISWYRS